MLLGVGAVLIFFLPASNVFFVVGTVVGERLLYLQPAQLEPRELQSPFRIYYLAYFMVLSTVIECSN